MKSFSNEILNFFLQKVLFRLHFGSCQNRMSSANLATLSTYWYIAQNFSLPFPCPSYLDAYLGLQSLADFLRWL